VIRHKHVQLDQDKINRAKRFLRVKTDTEAIDRALDVVVAEATINGALKRLGGRSRIKRVYD
jgi:hypothetical protein